MQDFIIKAYFYEKHPNGALDSKTLSCNVFGRVCFT